MCSSVIPSAWTSYFPLACVCSSVLSQFSWNFSFVPHLDLFRELSSCSCALLHFWPPDPHEQGCCRVPFSIFCPCIGCRPALAAWSSGFLSAQALSNFGLIFSFPTPELVFPVVCERAAKVGFSSCTQDLLFRGCPHACEWPPPLADTRLPMVSRTCVHNTDVILLSSNFCRRLVTSSGLDSEFTHAVALVPRWARTEAPGVIEGFVRLFKSSEFCVDLCVDCYSNSFRSCS
jgi:hypothetical protein